MDAHESVESVYRPCNDCMRGKHMIRRTRDPMVVSAVAESGDDCEIFIPGDTTYLRVGTVCYIPTLSSADTIPDGHDKTLSELWDIHGLLSLEWQVPYG